MLTKLMIDRIKAAIASIEALGSDTDEMHQLVLYTDDVDVEFGTLSADLNEPTFDGYSPKDLKVAAGNAGQDPLSFQQVVRLDIATASLGPWEASGATGLPQTVRGWALKTHDGLLIYGKKFATPYVIAEVGDQIPIPDVAIKFANTAFE